ncbi:glycosyltransferase family 4 protein [Roseivirga sp. E12]|uniref:MraY family glycosyltransferase n=1 Tax=Roseivirga sp. E12 TaxID=2819237 RepID=UPI001ABD475E|nr:glycosyltransferase family 4 protein [Roseivirga sp. E12]MBO3699068.1 glycosyltransferase family 4 protein [Roseivirga sp. E12]
MNTQMVQYALLSMFLFLGLSLYIRLARKYHIIDKPNERSSHSITTVRGGGIIFVLAILIFAIKQGFDIPYFLLGFFAISTISFLDDIKEKSKRSRLGIQLIAVVLLITQITQGQIEWWQWGLFLFMAMSSINFYNFMDGINGITAFYSLVLLGTLFYLYRIGQLVVAEELIVMPIISVIIFSFFNARKKARCFAGDVGSVSLAFIVVFLVGLLCWQQQSLIYIWLFGVYGVDTVLTIIQRILMGQNILKGHRLHLYQFMANEGRLPHIFVSTIYATLQALLNVFLLVYVIPAEFNLVWVNISMALFLIFIYVPVKYVFMRRKESMITEHSKAQSLAA